jgi:ABC-2 type transport system permease protein
MKVFIAVLINNTRRLLEQKQRLLLFPILTAVAIIAAMFFNTKSDVVGNVAVVSPSASLQSSDFLNVTRLDSAPPMSELVAGKYDAVVTYDSQGGYAIQTIKSEEFAQELDGVLKNPSDRRAGSAEPRGKGTNILGFILMFVMMQGFSLMFLFAEDKEKKQIQRVAASPVPFASYLCAHSFFTFMFLFLPIAAMLSAAYAISGNDVGFGLMPCILLAALQCAFAATFAQFFISLFKNSDTSNMIGSASVVLTSVLAGSFYSFDKGNKALEAIIKVLPQKAFLSLSDSIEKGTGMSSWLPYGLYIAMLIVAFSAVAVAKTQKEYVRG